MANNLVNIRVPEPIMSLMDTCCELYGFKRAELMRTATIHYCQSLLMTNSIEQIQDTIMNIRKRVELADDENKINSEMKLLDDILIKLKNSVGVE
jgi:hypothetical protein